MNCGLLLGKIKIVSSARTPFQGGISNCRFIAGHQLAEIRRAINGKGFFAFKVHNHHSKAEMKYTAIQGRSPVFFHAAPFP